MKLNPVIKVPEHNCILPLGTTIAAREGSLSCHTSEECVIQADFKNEWVLSVKGMGAKRERQMLTLKRENHDGENDVPDQRDNA